MPWWLVVVFVVALAATFLVLAFTELPRGTRILIALALQGFTGIVSYYTARSYRR